MSENLNCARNTMKKHVSAPSKKVKSCREKTAPREKPGQVCGRATWERVLCRQPGAHGSGNSPVRGTPGTDQPCRDLPTKRGRLGRGSFDCAGRWDGGGGAQRQRRGGPLRKSRECSSCDSEWPPETTGRHPWEQVGDEGQEEQGGDPGFSRKPSGRTYILKK